MRSVRVRLFLVVWVAAALHFATHVVREHYPAFALVARGDLRCDDWVIERPDPEAPGGVRSEPLHPDLFRHTDGNWYANNNVGASLVAAPVLLLLEPLLAKLEEIGKRQAAAEPAAGTSATPAAGTVASPATGTAASFESEYPMRRKFMAEVRRRGLHLRLGAAVAATAALVMAPAAALLALLVHDVLRRRGIAPGRAVALTLVFAFATPLLFRSAVLNHNQLEALAAFASFVLLLPGRRHPAPAGGGGTVPDPDPPPRRIALAGALAGTAVLLDYSGAVLAAGLLAWAWWRARGTGAARARAAGAFAAGALVPIGVLWLTQWWQFGDPFRPAQHWMPHAHFSVLGYHGLSLPSFDLLVRNLFDPSYGLFAFAPLLLLALFAAPTDVPRSAVPAAAGSPAVRADDPPGAARLVLSSPERSFLVLLSAAFVLFCAANQFTRLQWNTGFRALAPLVPFLFLLASDRLARLPPPALALIAVPCVLHSWVLAMMRATPPLEPRGFAGSTIARSWAAFLERGIDLPWLAVWRQTQPGGGPAWAAAAAPALLFAALALLALLWRAGERAAARRVA